MNNVSFIYCDVDSFYLFPYLVIRNINKNNILFVAFPSNRGGYAIKTIPKSLTDKTARMDFPEEWAGLEGEELEKVSSIKGLTFCHTGRFIVSCKDLKSVYKVLDKLCK